MPRESANVQLARALGVETTGLCRLVLTLAPGKAPLIEATYLIREAGALSECVRRLELVCAPAGEAAAPPTSPTADKEA